MKGDFTQFSFKPKNHYTQVRKQQGRVDLDADWNEYQDIQEYLAETIHTDVIGPCGAPKIGGGFKIESVASGGSDLTFSTGRIYVDGILCELENTSTYTTQPDDPAPPVLSPADGRADLVLLDVWKRHLTALEAPDIREVALGGPDTTTRIKTVWQVKVLEGIGEWVCGDELPKHNAILPPLEERGRLTSFADPSSEPEDVCDVPTAGGYRGLENRTYRAEIHGSGDINTATFKWSRDNGSVVFAIEAFNPGDPLKVTLKSLGRDQVLGLQIGNWVEVTGDTSELHGVSGTLARIEDLNEAKRELKLSKDVSAHNREGHPKVRRWDQKSDAIPVSANEIELELGVKVKFTDGAFQTGDYWVFTARTALNDVEHLADAPPLGIEHHYCTLARLIWKAEKAETDENNGASIWKANLTDCRPEFPWLTDLPDNCDLSFHNKHLHGWGIVCGLKVSCGEGDRNIVNVQPGYALDCDGNDIVLKKTTAVSVIELVKAWDEKNPNYPILKDGRGKIMLVIRQDENGKAYVEIRPYDEELGKNTLAARLEGTLLIDILSCILNPLTGIRNLLVEPETPEGEKNKGIVDFSKQQLTALHNLIVQIIDPKNGSNVFLSLDEHRILRKLYDGIKEILRSPTLCGIFDDDQPFPNYPFPRHHISTIFGMNYDHNRIRIHPSGALGYTFGGENGIGIYDLREKVMVGFLDPPIAENVTFHDVAFSKDGKQLFAVGGYGLKGTIFAVADVNLDTHEHTWTAKKSIIPDIRLVTLATAPLISDHIYAIGLGQGLYEIDPSEKQIEANLVRLNNNDLATFNAVGHLEIVETIQMAFATSWVDSSKVQREGDSFNQVVGINLMIRAPKLSLMLPDGKIGRDDIKVIPQDGSGELRGKLLVVATDTTKDKNKQLIAFDVNDRKIKPHFIDLESNTLIRLLHVPRSRYLIISYEDDYQLRLVDLQEGNLIENFHLPVQIAPIAMAYDPDLEHFNPRNDRRVPEKRLLSDEKCIFVWNRDSATWSVIPAIYLTRGAAVGVKPIPGEDDFISELGNYRTQILTAYIQLLGNIVQTIKDCICQHLLINCPECKEDDEENEIYLGGVRIENNRVFQICNFAQRKYVKSFPTVDYWLSLIPISPIVGWAVEKLCCAVLPDHLNIANIFKFVEFVNQRRMKAVAQNVFMGGGKYQELYKDSANRVNVAKRVSGEWIGAMVDSAVNPLSGIITHQEIVGKPVESAMESMQNASIEIIKVETYDPSQGAQNLSRISQTPLNLQSGSKVILYVQDNIVRYYALAEEPAIQIKALNNDLRLQKDALDILKTQIAVPIEPSSNSQVELPETLFDLQALQNELNIVREQMETKDQELGALRTRLEILEKKQLSDMTSLEKTINRLTQKK